MIATVEEGISIYKAELLAFLREERDLDKHPRDKKWNELRINFYKVNDYKLRSMSKVLGLTEKEWVQIRESVMTELAAEK